MHHYCKDAAIEANGDEILTILHVDFNYALCFRIFVFTGEYGPKVYPLPKCLKEISYGIGAIKVLRDFKSLYSISANRVKGASMDFKKKGRKTKTDDAARWLKRLPAKDEFEDESDDDEF